MSYTVPPFYHVADAERRCLRREETNLSTQTCQKPLDHNAKLVTVMIVEILDIYSQTQFNVKLEVLKVWLQRLARLHLCDECKDLDKEKNFIASWWLKDIQRELRLGIDKSFYNEES